MATVTVKQGTILGTTGKNLDGETFFKFLGIPYAKPPLGLLRFKAPQPPEKWTGTKDCTKDGSPNFGLSFHTREVIGSEDCLYLNVHTKSLPQPGESLKPVLVFIHGGAFTLGSGTQEMCDPSYFLTQDVVLVTINYRLGVFGFLSLDDTDLDVPGNAGLKDQTQALKWVQENIQQFNGDSDNVTIFGISAGGASVQFQVISPSSKGLFHKAIAQSGSVFNPWAWGQKNAIQVVETLGKKVSSETEALKILLEVDGEKLFKSTQTISDCLIISDIRRPFGPVIEKPNPTAFLTESPAEILKSGKFNQVPIIQGLCSNEGLISELGDLISLPKDFKPNEHLIPWSLNSKHPNFCKWKETIQELYYKNGVTQPGKHQHVGDNLFNVGVIESTKMALKHSKYPIYFYQLDYNTEIVKKFRKMLKVDDSITGMSHGGDQDLLFPMSIFGSNSLPDPDDVKAIKTVIEIWTNFARTGVPHPKWQPITSGQEFNYLKLTENLEMSKNLFEERMRVWSKILEEAGGFDMSCK